MEDIKSRFSRGKKRKDDFYLWYSGEATKLTDDEERAKVEERAVNVMQNIMRATIGDLETYHPYYAIVLSEVGARAHEVLGRPNQH